MITERLENFLNKKGNIEHMNVKMLIVRITIIVGWGLLFPISQYAVKHFMTELPGITPTWKNINFVFHCKWFYIAATVFPASVVLSSLSYRYMPVSSAGPIFFTLGSVISLLVGVMFFTETISLMKGIGIALCMIGIALMILE